MAIVLNGTTGITAPDIDVTAQSTDIVTTGDVSAVDGTFSGGVYLGGTGAANYLDDYEEGTWTPLPADAATGGNTGSWDNVAYATYTKIGNLVTVFMAATNMDATGMTVGNNLYMRGLPFTSNIVSLGSVSGNYTTSGEIHQNAAAFTSGDYVVIQEQFSNSNEAYKKVDDFNSGADDLTFTIQYTTAS